MQTGWQNLTLESIRNISILTFRFCFNRPNGHFKCFWWFWYLTSIVIKRSMDMRPEYSNLDFCYQQYSKYKKRKKCFDLFLYVAMMFLRSRRCGFASTNFRSLLALSPIFSAQLATRGAWGFQSWIANSLWRVVPIWPTNLIRLHPY